MDLNGFQGFWSSDLLKKRLRRQKRKYTTWQKLAVFIVFAIFFKIFDQVMIRTPFLGSIGPAWLKISVHIFYS